jgi:geranylgeranyl pyrophosphate synthase
MHEIIKGTDVERDLEKLEDILQEAIKSEEPELSRMSGHILFSGGRRIRPTVGIVVYKATWGRSVEEFLPVTAALELIHTANLIHEDLIYKAPTHRGAPSMHKMFGKNESIVTADFLYAKAFGLCTHYGPDILNMAVKACVRLAEGELLMIRHSLRDTTIEEYLEIITRKYAETFSWTARAAAWIARAHLPRLESMEVLGQHLGLSHQIIDDYLDLAGSECTGEPKGTEVLQGKPTLPIIRARDQLSDKNKKQLLDIYKKRKRDRNDVKRVMRLVSTTDGLEFTKQKAADLVEAALKEVDKLDETPYKKMLTHLCQHVVDRCG